MTPSTFPDRLWYAATPERDIPHGTRITRQYLGKTFMIGRDGDGRTIVDQERCETCFHRIGHGLLWLYAGDDIPQEAPPLLSKPDGEAPQVAESVVLPCDFDNAVYGLIDPAHGPYVHASRWWRPRRGLQEKRKRIIPNHRGFTMARHEPTQGALGYRLLGTGVTTEIRFELPGIRTEIVEGSRARVVSVTAMTPLTQRRTQMLHLLYWDARWLNPLRPLARRLVRRFIGQDLDIITKQQEGLHKMTGQMLVGDADAPMRFYLDLKHEWAHAQHEGREFSNPITETILRWRT